MADAQSIFDNALKPTAAAGDAAPATPSRVYTLLFVDDEPSVLSALRRLFRNPSYRVLQAGGGSEAMSILALEPVDLIISDMRMPEMDGAALLEQVRILYPATIRILLTGYADINSTIAAINGGEIHRYISKPWDDQDILLIVKEALERRDLERQNKDLLQQVQRQNLELQGLNQSLEDRVKARVAEIQQVADMLDASYDELAQTFNVALQVFSGMLEMRHSGMAGHSRRVAELSRNIAIRLELDPNTQNEVYTAALLHDIGKLGYPDSMLGKPTSMYTPNEKAIYHKHCEAAESALMPLTRFHGVAHIIKQHHERPDGFGFPAGLMEHQIHIGALIIGAASDYDGLTQGGAAPTTYSLEDALALMRPLAGKHYDKRVLVALEQEVKNLAPPEQADYLVLPHELKPGMRLARDLLTPKGTLLLPKGLIFNPRLVQQIQKFAEAQRNGPEIALYVLHDRSAPPKGAAPATDATTTASAAGAARV